MPTITPVPGEEVAVREAVLNSIPQVHEEPGCELYALHEGDGEFVIVERWASPEALKVHSTAEPLARPGAGLAGKGQGPPAVRRFSPVPAGNPEKGRI